MPLHLGTIHNQRRLIFPIYGLPREPLLVLIDVVRPPNPKSTKPAYPSEKNVMYNKNFISLVIAH